MHKISIAIGVDHRGYNLKQFLVQRSDIYNISINWIDCGTHSKKRTDYPIFTKAVVSKLQTKEVNFGILACGSGIGMSIVANRYPGIFAGLVWNKEIAQEAKEDDNINVLVLPSDYISNKKSIDIIGVWLTSKFKKNRYEKRLKMIDTE